MFHFSQSFQVQLYSDTLNLVYNFINIKKFINYFNNFTD